jgi:hypothetical protein
MKLFERRRIAMTDRLRAEVEAKRQARKAIPIRPIQIQEVRNEHVRQH